MAEPGRHADVKPGSSTSLQPNPRPVGASNPPAHAVPERSAHDRPAHASALRAERAHGSVPRAEPDADLPAALPAAAVAAARETEVVAEKPTRAQRRLGGGSGGTGRLGDDAETGAGGDARWSAGRVGYRLAWCGAIVLGGAAVALRFGVPYPKWTVTGAIAVAALVGAVALHLGASGLNRRRDVGLSATAVAMVLVLIPVLGAAALLAAYGASRASVSVHIDDTSEPIDQLPPVYQDLPGDPLPEGPLPDDVTPPPDATASADSVG